MIRFLTKLIILPLEVFVSSMEAFSKAMRDIQRTFAQDVDNPAPGPALTVGNAAGEGTDSLGDNEVNLTEDAPAQGSNIAQEQTLKEKVTMPDQDLSGDDLKLVRYKVLFTKREYEHSFPEKEELVPDDMDATRFTSWKIAEFAQTLKGAEDAVRRIQPKWGKYLINQSKQYIGEAGEKLEEEFEAEMKKDEHVYFDKWEYVDVKKKKGQKHVYYYLKELPEDDKKYLRLFFEVLDRFAREKFRHDERQIEVLEEIRDRMKKK
jgi:hypothetical protein